MTEKLTPFISFTLYFFISRSLICNAVALHSDALSGSTNVSYDLILATFSFVLITI
jgi:hypothetical protein